MENLYFSKVTEDYWTSKNRVQEEAKQIARSMDRIILAESNIESFKKDFREQIERLNEKHNRCKNLNLNIWNSQGVNKTDIHITIPGVFKMTIYKAIPQYNKSNI